MYKIEVEYPDYTVMYVSNLNLDIILNNLNSRDLGLAMTSVKISKINQMNNELWYVGNIGPKIVD